MLNLMVGIEIFLPFLIVFVMIWTILLVIAILLSIMSINNLIKLHILTFMKVTDKEIDILYTVNSIILSIGLTYIIWYCN